MLQLKPDKVSDLIQHTVRGTYEQQHTYRMVRWWCVSPSHTAGTKCQTFLSHECSPSNISAHPGWYLWDASTGHTNHSCKMCHLLSALRISALNFADGKKKCTNSITYSLRCNYSNSH